MFPALGSANYIVFHTLLEVSGTQSNNLCSFSFPTTITLSAYLFVALTSFILFPSNQSYDDL